MKINYLAWVLLIAAPLSFACQSGRSIDVLFDKNSSDISAIELEKLTNWTHEVKQALPDAESIALGANAETGEDEPIILGRQREAAVRMALKKLDFTAPIFYGAEKVYVVRPGTYGSDPDDDVKRVEIDYQPACPRSCVCTYFKIIDPTR